MLFDYSYVKSARPYHTNYKTPLAVTEEQRKASRRARINDIFGKIGVGVAGAIPVFGTALSAVMKTVGGSQQAKDEAQMNEYLNSLTESSYQSYLDQLPEEAMATARPDVGINYNPDLGNQIGSAVSTVAGAASKSGMSNADYFSSMGINMPDPVTTYEQNEPNNFPTDNSIGGTTIETVGSGTFMNYEDGGKIVIGGNGEDDIALVDTTTGQDTGVRVAGNELIVSEDNLLALKEAIGKGNKKKVFDIMAMQIDEVPEVENGVMGFKEGGVLSKVEKASDVELASLADNWYKMTTAEQNAIEAEAEKRGLLLTRFGSQGMSIAPKIYKGNKAIEPIKDFDFFAYKKSGTPTTGEVQTVEEQFIRTMPKEARYGQSAMDVDPDAFERRTIPQLANSPLAPLNYDQPQNLITPPKRTGTGGGGTQRVAGTTIDLTGMQRGIPQDILESSLVQMDELAPVNTNLVDTGIVNVEETNPYALTGSDYMNLGTSALGYGFDAWRMSKGLKGARQPLPRWSVPARFTNYLDRLEAMSTQGLSAAEMAGLQSEADRTYLYDVENIRNLSGGNAGVALGNLGRASAGRNRNALNIAALDRQAQLQNLGIYGGAVAQDVNLDRMQFGDVYNEALMSKQAASQLASDAMTNMMERFNTDRFYGVGSEGWKTKKMQQELLNENLGIKKSQRQAYANMDWLPTGGTKTDAQFANDERKYTLAELKAMGLI